MIIRKVVSVGAPAKVEMEWCGATLPVLVLETNGPQGGDAGHGGYLSITYKDGGVVAVSCDDGPQKYVNSVTIVFSGDDELRSIAAFLEALSLELPRLMQGR